MHGKQLQGFLVVVTTALVLAACGGGEDGQDSVGSPDQTQEDRVQGADSGLDLPGEDGGWLDQEGTDIGPLPDGRIPENAPSEDATDALVSDMAADAPLDLVPEASPQDLVDSSPGNDLHGDDLPGDTGTPDLPGEVVWSLGVEVASPLQWQRGPVVIDYEVTGSGKDLWTAELVWKGTTTDWEECTPLAGYGEKLVTIKGDGMHRFVWDSMADVPALLGPVWVQVRIVPEGGIMATAKTEQFGLLNEPDAVRQVLVTSSINGNNKLRRYNWTHGQGMSAEKQLLQVKPYPVRVSMAPNGYVAAIVEENAESVSLLHLNADTGAVSIAGSVAMTDLYPVDAVFSGDGATLFVAVASPNPEGGVYRVDLDPQTGLAVPAGKPQQIHSQFQLQAVELLPDGKGLVVLGPDPGANLAGLHLATIDFSGKLLDTYDLVNDGALPRSISVSPDGKLLLVSWANLFGGGEGVALIGLSSYGAMTFLDQVTAEDPEEAVFGASGDRGIVSEAFANKVTGLVVTPSSLERTNSIKMGLPTRLARTTWGADSDTFLITTISSQTGVSSLAAVAVGPTGSLTLDKYYGMGNGNDVIPQDVAIQP